MSATGATERLSRLLAMVPWLLQRQGVPLAEAARHFGITQDQLVKDLELLFVCGTPGHLPDDLIEADWDSGRVFLDNADPISRPLRLGVDEAVALLAGLRTLADVPGLHDRDVVATVLDKLATAAGEAAAGADALRVDLSRGAQEHVLAAARDAVRRRRRVRLRYLVPSRDETTDRDVDPVRVLNAGDQWYLEGWCHRAEDVRLFRVDRVLEIAVLDVDGTPPRGATRGGAGTRTTRTTTRAGTRGGSGSGPRGPTRGTERDLFTPSQDDTLVTAELEPGARWVAEYYPVEDVEELAGGRLRVRLWTASEEWLLRLALRLGGGLVVISPSGIARRVAALADAALAPYGPPGQSPAPDPTDPMGSAGAPGSAGSAGSSPSAPDRVVPVTSDDALPAAP